MACATFSESPITSALLFRVTGRKTWESYREAADTRLGTWYHSRVAISGNKLLCYQTRAVAVENLKMHEDFSCLASKITAHGDVDGVRGGPYISAYFIVDTWASSLYNFMHSQQTDYSKNSLKFKWLRITVVNYLRLIRREEFRSFVIPST
jgi:hypothetical protein